jgi:dihydrofolate synthase/folylpolyglutamate synthase
MFLNFLLPSGHKDIKNLSTFTSSFYYINMTYIETLSYLYACTPAFHQVGQAAYKPGLERSIALDSAMRNPHRGYFSVHVAGTNGKGSVAHMLAAVLREAKYRVGLYTSPHLVDFCERIRVNGKKFPSSTWLIS